jgi:hypothetical protein
MRIGALTRALSRHGDVEGDYVTVDRVVHHQVAVMAELGRVGGVAHCVVIDNLKVSAVGRPARRAHLWPEGSGVGEEVIVLQWPA